MSGVHNLRQQLERLGLEPVPPARPEHRAELLARILETTRESAPSGASGLRVVDGGGDGARVGAAAGGPQRPVDELQRRRRTRVLAQAAAAVSIAAAAAGVLGVVSLVDNGQSTPGVAGADIDTEAELASGESLTHVVIKPSGELEAEGGGPADMKDGPAKMTCEVTTATTMVFYDIAERGYYCPPEAVVEVEVLDDAIVSVNGAQPAPARFIKFRLDQPAQASKSDPLTWTWERYSGRRFGHYELRRYADGGDPGSFEVVATLTDLNQTTYRESSVPGQDSIYYVAVVAPDGSESGRSSEYKVSITIKTSD